MFNENVDYDTIRTDARPHRFMALRIGKSDVSWELVLLEERHYLGFFFFILQILFSIVVTFYS